jgi:predicted PurR-regulated permease PerM
MLLDVGLDTLIGGLLLAVLMAMVTASAYLWLRRGKSEVTAILVALILIANLACLVTGASFIDAKSQTSKMQPVLSRIGSLNAGREPWQTGAPRRSGRFSHRSKQTSSSGSAASGQNVNGKPAAPSPE